MADDSRKADTLIGLKLGDYTVQSLLAKGGMGKVFEAVDDEIGRKVAIKVITLDEDVADEMMERFKREAMVIGQLDHPHIITIYRYGKDQGVHYFAMKLIDGASLSEYNRSLRDDGRQIEPIDLIRILKHVASALDYAHAKGVVHRDVKPANIMIETTPTGPHATLMDFGLVMRVDNTVTHGTAFGTPRYISPEQAIASRQAVAQSDIYSLGIIVYELLAGQPPFDDEETPIAVALSHVTKPPPNPQQFRESISDDVVAVLMKVLEKEPERRYQTASDFVEALEKALLSNRETDVVEIAHLAKVVPPPAKKQTSPATIEEADPDTAVPAPAQVQSKPTPPAQRRRRRSYLLPALLLLLVLLGAGLVLAGIVEIGGDASDEGSSSISEINGSDDDAVRDAPSAVGQLELYLMEEGGIALRNPNNFALDLLNVVFQTDDVQFHLDDFGRSTLTNWRPGLCGYVLVIRQELLRPGACLSSNEQTPLRYVRNADFVWNTSARSFEVWQDDRVLGTCDLTANTCQIDGIRRAG